MINDTTVITAPQLVTGIRESTLGADAGAALSVKVSQVARLYAAYDGRFRSNLTSHAGTVGAETTVRATPDGYTIIMVSGSYGTNAALYKLPYDPINDIAPIVLVGESGFMVSLNPKVPVASIKELIAYARANPGKLNYGSTGTGLHSNDPRFAEIAYWTYDDLPLLNRQHLPAPNFDTAGFAQAHMVITEGDNDTIISLSKLGFGPREDLLRNEDKFSYLGTSYKGKNSRKVKAAQKALEEVWLNELLKLGVSPHSYRTEYKGAEL